MSLMLASVNSLHEAQMVYRLNVDIIDLKQPEKGALGALSIIEVAEIVRKLKPDAQLSATVGDLPMQADVLSQAVKAMASTGVDFVKIGFFPDGDWPSCIAALSALAKQDYRLIAVLFADTGTDFSITKTLAKAGFHGVMLDTMHKKMGSLTGFRSLPELQSFVETARSNSLLTGLAGSLSLTDVPLLSALKADYLGFRGALCKQSCRTSELDEVRICQIRELLKLQQDCLSAA